MSEEKKIENQIKSYLKSINAYFLKVHGNSMQPAGTPDLLCCVNGHFVAIEVKKSKGGVVSELQEAKIKQIQQSGGIAFIARSVDDVKQKIQYLS